MATNPGSRIYNCVMSTTPIEIFTGFAAAINAGWRGYFAMCPDYQIRIEHALAQDNLTLAAGVGGGTIDGVEWRTPAAWKAVIRDAKVAEFHVFAGNKPVYEILARRQRST
jgi:hypothetical protein